MAQHWHISGCYLSDHSGCVVQLAGPLWIILIRFAGSQTFEVTTGTAWCEIKKRKAEASWRAFKSVILITDEMFKSCKDLRLSSLYHRNFRVFCRWSKQDKKQAIWRHNLHDSLQLTFPPRVFWHFMYVTDVDAAHTHLPYLTLFPPHEAAGGSSWKELIIYVTVLHWILWNRLEALEH